MTAHPAKKLLPAELIGMGSNLVGIDLHVGQAPDRCGDRLDRLFGGEPFRLRGGV
jgi:hypothetical protein